jgi:hypothetical protein
MLVNDSASAVKQLGDALTELEVNGVLSQIGSPDVTRLIGSRS